MALNPGAAGGMGSAKAPSCVLQPWGPAEIVDLCFLLEDDISGLCFRSSAEWIGRLCVSLK